ncbi:MAG: hypothetical protein WAN59_14845 [Candidatus Baltobacteraceae bacterium]
MTALVAARFSSTLERDVAGDSEHADDPVIDERRDHACDDVDRLTVAMGENRFELDRLAGKRGLEVRFGALEFAGPHMPGEVGTAKLAADERSCRFIAGNDRAVPAVECHGIVAEGEQGRVAFEGANQLA